jgi:PEP-CTERM motif
MKKKIGLSIIVLLGVSLFLMVGMVTVQAAPYSLIMDLSGPGYYKDLDTTASDYGVWQVWNGTLLPDWTATGIPNVMTYIGNANPAEPVGQFYDVTVGSDDLRIVEYANALGYAFFYLSPSALYSGLNNIGTATENPNGSYSWTDTYGDIYLIYTEGRAPNPVPEPATMLLLGLGLLGLVGVRRKIKG